MASLTKTVQNVRKVVIVVLVVAAVILVGDVLIQTIQRDPTPNVNTLTPWLDADEAFGIIPTPVIPSLQIGPESNPTFAIDGDLPDGDSAPSSALVYKIQEPVITLSTTDEAAQTANLLGFTATPEQTTQGQEVIMRWSNPSGTRTLEYRINPSEYERWKLITQYFLDSQARLPKEVTDDKQLYAGSAKSLLSAIRLNIPTLGSGFTEVTFAKLGVDGFFSVPLSARTADYVDAQIYHRLPIALTRNPGQLTEEQRKNLPENIDGKVFRTDPRKGSVGMSISDEAASPILDLYSFEMNKFRFNESNYAIYPVITPTQAWQRVRDGEGSLTLLQLRNADKFDPNRALNVAKFTADADATELAYFEGETWNLYLHPIYVFRGTMDTVDGEVGRFVFYVDALERL